MFIEVVNYPLDRGFKFVLCVFQMNKFRLQRLKNLLFQTNNGSYLAGAPLLGWPLGGVNHMSLLFLVSCCCCCCLVRKILGNHSPDVCPSG